MAKPKHPLMVGVERNEQMRAWDVSALVGNFKTERDAQDFGRRLAELLEREYGFEGGFVQ